MKLKKYILSTLYFIVCGVCISQEIIKDSSANKPVDIHNDSIESFNIEKFKDLVDSVMKSALNKPKFSFLLKLEEITIDTTKEFTKHLLHKNYLKTKEYSFTAKPPYTEYRFKIKEHVYSSNNAADSIMDRIYTMCGTTDLFSKSPTYYLRNANIIYNMRLGCPYAGLRHKQFRRWLNNAIFYKKDDVDSLVGRCGGGCQGIEQKKMDNLKKFKGKYKWHLQCALDTGSRYGSFGYYNKEKTTEFLNTRIEIKEKHVKFGMITHNLKFNRITILPSTYKYFHRPYWAEKRLQTVPEHLLNMQGKIVHNHIFTEDINFLLIEFPNGKIGTIKYGCLFYLEKI
jgi:hypothetical protein